MAYGDPITSPIPTVGGTIGPEYASQVNTLLQEIRDRLATQVDQSGILIGGTLELNSNKMSEITSLAFDDLSLPLGGTREVYFSGGNLYADDGSGNSVQITSGGTLNVASVSGINGTGYGTSGVEILWVAGSTLYKFKDGSGANQYADAQVQRIKVTDVSNGNAATVEVPALAGNYTLQLPAALPASTSALTLSAAGLMESTRALSLDSFTADNYYHSAHPIFLAATTGVCFNAAGNAVQPSTGQLGAYRLDGTGGVVSIPINFKVGKTITDITAYWNPWATAGSKYFRIRSLVVSTGVTAVLWSDILTSASSSYQEANAALTPFVIEDLKTYFFEFTGLGDEEIFGVKLSYSEAP